MLRDTDILDGVNGWEEYVTIDAAIKALRKEESDTSILMAEKAAMMKRILDSAPNRDAGQPDFISNTRNASGGWGYGGVGGFNDFGGEW